MADIETNGNAEIFDFMRVRFDRLDEDHSAPAVSLRVCSAALDAMPGRAAFAVTRSLAKAKARYPRAQAWVQVRGGIWCFESE